MSFYRRLNIRQRILLTFLSVVIIGGVLQLLIAGGQLQDATLEFYRHHLETDALMLAAALAEPMEDYRDERATDEIRETLAVMGREGRFEYLVTDAQRRIIVNSPGMLTTDALFPQTPEIQQAQAYRVGSASRDNPTGVRTQYVAAPILYESQPLGFVVLTQPMQPAYDEVTQQWLQLGGTTLPVIALTVFASLGIAASIARPIREMSQSALQMADGVLDTRIQVDSQDEIGQLAHSFNHMAERLEALIAAQRAFVSHAAHELRTPLMTMKLRVEAVQDPELDADQCDVYLREIGDEIEHMGHLVRSLLMLARLDEGRHKSESAEDVPNGDTLAMLHDVARSWRVQAAYKGLDFQTHVDPDLSPLPLSANDLRLVLDNLLNNALKYTETGWIRVQAYADGQTIRLAVSDSGIGFTAEQASRLFDRFYRSDNARTTTSGTGLGLSIVQAVLDMYGGDISAHSDGPGHGATFTVRLTSREDIPI